MPRKLLDIDIDEMTLCKSPANRKKFFIKKEEDLMKEFIEVLKKFMAEDEDKIDEALTDEEVTKVEKLSDEDMKGLKDALDTLSAYDVENIPVDALKAIKTFVKQASLGNPIEKVDEAKLIEEFANINKAGSRFSKTTIEQLKRIKEAIMKLIGEKEKELSKGHKDLPDDVKASLEELATLKKAETERLEKETQKREQKEKEDKEDILKRLEAVEKAKGIKKSIDGQTGDKDVKKGADGEDLEDPYPSIPLPVKITG